MPSALNGTVTQDSWKLVLNIDTRWNSIFLMIECAIYLKVAIDAFIEKEVKDWEAYYNWVTKNGSKPYPKKGRKQPLIVADALSKEDWQILTEYMQILEPLKECTKELEGRAENGELNW